MIKGYETLVEEINSSNFSPEEKFRLESFVNQLFEYSNSKGFGSIPPSEPKPAPAPIEPPKQEEPQPLPPPVNVVKPKKQKKQTISLKDLGIEDDLDKLISDFEF
jgi:hypothetical protein